MRDVEPGAQSGHESSVLRMKRRKQREKVYMPTHPTITLPPLHSGECCPTPASTNDAASSHSALAQIAIAQRNSSSSNDTDVRDEFPKCILCRCDITNPQTSPAYRYCES